MGIRIRRLLTLDEQQDCFTALLHKEIWSRNLPHCVINDVLSKKPEIMANFTSGITYVKAHLALVCDNAMASYQKAQLLAQTPASTSSS